MTQYFRVPNLEVYQHYKDRSPPWIKLHRSVLVSYEFSRLKDASKAHLIQIWLLASSLENKIPLDAEWVGRHINATEPIDLDELQAFDFIELLQSDSAPLATGLQGAGTEREKRQRRGQSKRETKVNPDRATAQPPAKPDILAIPDFLHRGKAQAKSHRCWEAYSAAYFDRYGTQPVRNAKVNSMLCKLVDRLGDEAPDVAAFYLTHNTRWYVEKGHSVDCLLNDAEKIRTEWATGNKVTGAKARQTDETATSFQNADEAARMIEDGQADPYALQPPMRKVQIAKGK